MVIDTDNRVSLIFKRCRELLNIKKKDQCVYSIITYKGSLMLDNPL